MVYNLGQMLQREGPVSLWGWGEVCSVTSDSGGWSLLQPPLTTALSPRDTSHTKVNGNTSLVAFWFPTIVRILGFIHCLLLYCHKPISYERDFYCLIYRKEQQVTWPLQNTDSQGSRLRVTEGNLLEALFNRNFWLSRIPIPTPKLTFHQKLLRNKLDGVDS